MSQLAMQTSFFFHFSNVQQEMEPQFGSIPPAKSSKIVILSFTSKAKHGAVYFLLKSVLLLSLQNQFFDNSNSYVEQEIKLKLN